MRSSLLVFVFLIAVLPVHANRLEALKRFCAQNKTDPAAVWVSHGFDFYHFRDAFGAAHFIDKNAQPFRFGGISAAGVVNLDVTHSTHGPISSVPSWAERGDHLRLSPEGNLDGTSWSIAYGEHQNLGFLSGFFEFVRDRLPEGSRFAIHDASQSKDFLSTLSDVPRKKIHRFASEHPEGKRLFALFSRMVRLDTFHKGRLPEPVDVIDGFRMYLMDLGSVWGRIARKGNYRRDYLSIDGLLSPTVFVKREIPPELVLEEDALIDSLGPIPDLLSAAFKKRP